MSGDSHNNYGTEKTSADEVRLEYLWHRFKLLNEELSTAQEALSEAIEKNSGDIAVLTLDLTNKYNALITLIGELPEGVSVTEYVDGIEETLRTTIDTLNNSVQKLDEDMGQAIQRLADDNTILKEKNDSQQIFLVIVCVIASLALVGCGGFVGFYFFVEKKKN